MRSVVVQVPRVAFAIIVATTAGNAWGQAVHLSIPAQSAASGIEEFARQTGAQMLISQRHAHGRSTREVVGDFEIAAGLTLLLNGSGLEALSAGPNTWTIVPARGHSGSTGKAKTTARRAVTDIPEILVQGHYWSLNTGIPRTEDDGQPYIVFEREQLQRSGARTIEDFFRSYLGPNTAVSTSNENIQQAGFGRLNLRGLGSAETLILLDGRRLAAANAGSGYIEQANVAGLAIESIERIEVLASSVSSIYGANATGGVINIIRKRDYRGFEATVQYGDVVHGSASERRFGLSGGWDFNEGRTQASFSTAWHESDALLLGQRPYHQRYRAFAEQNNPLYVEELPFPPVGATPNILSAEGEPLVLDDGVALGSRFTHVPDGYRGYAIDGSSGLIANAGTYNYEYGQTSVAGALEPLTNQSTSKFATLAARHEVLPWWSVYAEASFGEDRWSGLTNMLPTGYIMSGDAPGNPFQQSIWVTFPNIGADVVNTTQFDTWRGSAGTIVRLPRQWQLAFDWTRSGSRYRQELSAPPHDLATNQAMRDGTIDVLRDMRLSPIAYGYVDTVDTSLAHAPADAINTTGSLRLAGALPFDAGGGAPAATFLVERSEDRLESASQVINTDSLSWVHYTPARSRVTHSAYAEVRVPLFSEANAAPWLKGLDLQVAARYDKFIGHGADATILCRRGYGALLSQSEIDAPCPDAGASVPRATNVASSTNPTYSLRWEPDDDLMLRASFARGFRPAYLHQLIKLSMPVHSVGVTDPLRGNEPVGVSLEPLSTDRYLLGDGNFAGGNPDLKPERSVSHSAGMVIRPSATPGLRISADWTRIDKRDGFYDPIALLYGGMRVAGKQPGLVLESDEGQQQFDAVFIRKYPERLVRGAPTDGFAVGPIIAIDASMMNLLEARSESWDYAIDYGTDVPWGQVDISFRGTYLKDLSIEMAPGQPPVEVQGVVNDYFARGMSATGGVQKKGTLTAMWTGSRWQLGWQVRYIGKYHPRDDRSYIEELGSNVVKSQAYNDLFARCSLGDHAEIRVNVENIFDRDPPFDVRPNGYSPFADPRQAAYSVTLSYAY